MIVVELKEAPRGPGDYQVVARLTVNDDGTYQLDDPEQKFLTDVPVPAPDAEGRLQRVFFADDPATWARNAEALHRSLTAVELVTDTGIPEGVS